MRLTIRPATVADIPLILRLVKDLAEYERAPQEAVATVESVTRHFFGDGLGRGPMAECLIGEVDGVAEGLAVYFHNFSTWTGVPGMYLEDLFVRPAARGSGLGKALLAKVASVAVSRGCPRLDWMVIDWNEPAMGFYRKLGAEGLTGWTTWRLKGEALTRLAQSAAAAK
ncbi:MAG: GNAT family N-acetyltransferase [Phycisphaerales bacterium]